MTCDCVKLPNHGFIMPTRSADCFPGLMSTAAAIPSISAIEGDTDERQPLLELSPSEVMVDGGTEDELEESAQEILIKDVTETRSRWTIAVYAILALSGVLLLAIFIKGFIDADDVEVNLISIWISISSQILVV